MVQLMDKTIVIMTATSYDFRLSLKIFSFLFLWYSEKTTQFTTKSFGKNRQNQRFQKKFIAQTVIKFLKLSRLSLLMLKKVPMLGRIGLIVFAKIELLVFFYDFLRM